MTEERKIALRILAHYLDNMDYWEEEHIHYADSDTDIKEVNRELLKISKQIIKRYGLNRDFI